MEAQVSDERLRRPPISTFLVRTYTFSFNSVQVTKPPGQVESLCNEFQGFETWASLLCNQHEEELAETLTISPTLAANPATLAYGEKEKSIGRRSTRKQYNLDHTQVYELSRSSET